MGVSLSDIKLRVTYYSRVSTDHLEQKKSLRNQVEHFERYIEDNLNWIYVEGYVDDGISGTSDIKRDNFMRMIEDAKTDHFDLIITKEISRFSRNTLDSIKYTRLLLSYGVFVLFVNDNINTALPDSELRLTIMASMAQDEIRRLSERVKFGMRRAVERGEILGNDMLYGYKKDKTCGGLNIVESEAMIVRRMYELYAIDELSLCKISKLFNSENIKTGLGKKWSVSTISRMIANPKYKGYYCAKKTEVVDYMTKKVKYFDADDWIIYSDNIRIPAIVDENLWKRANDRLNKRRKYFSARKIDKGIYKNRYLYSAKIYCGECGNVFHRREFRKHKRDITWVCSKYLRSGKVVCDSPNIRESELNFIFRDLIFKLQIDLQKVISILIGFYKYDKIDDLVDDKIEKAIKKRENIYLKKDKLLELNMDGSLSNSEFMVQNNKFNQKLEEIERYLKSLFLEKEKLSNTCIKTKKLNDILVDKVNSQFVIEKVISLILGKVVVSKIDGNKNNMELNVFLTYEGGNDIEENLCLKKDYQFKRGYDTIGTPRYSVNYSVNCYLYA